MPQSPSDSKSKSALFSNKIWKIGAILAFIAVLLLLFKALFSLLLLTLAAALIAIYFHGCAGLFQKYFHWPSRLCLILSVSINIILIAALIWFLGARIQQQVVQLSEKLPTTIENAKEQISQTPIGSKVLHYFHSSGSSQKTLKVAKEFLSSGFGLLSDVYIIMLMALFFTVSPSTYKKGVILLLPLRAKEKGRVVFKQLEIILKKWIKSQLIGIVSIGVLTAIGLMIIGMPLVLTLAIIAGLLNTIPNFGPLIALIPAVLIALMQGPTTALIVILMYTVIQIIQSMIEKPLVQKKMVNIPPALTIFAQVALGLLVGLWGVVLAVPVIAITKTIVRELYIKNQDGIKA